MPTPTELPDFDQQGQQGQQGQQSQQSQQFLGGRDQFERGGGEFIAGAPTEALTKQARRQPPAESSAESRAKGEPAFESAPPALDPFFVTLDMAARRSLQSDTAALVKVASALVQLQQELLAPAPDDALCAAALATLAGALPDQRSQLQRLLAAAQAGGVSLGALTEAHARAFAAELENRDK